jgi:chemotaxis response regulator CheB
MTTVAVCGASLLTSIIADHLAATPSITVVPIDPDQPGATMRVLAAHPDVALIDCAATTAGASDRLLLALLRTCIDFPVVTLDAGGGAALLTSQCLGVESIEALVGWVGGLEIRRLEIGD